jgi:cytoskeletal protein CcmA (bactofilin family)
MAVLVGGRVSGGIRAQERICLLPTAVVTGELRAPWLDVRLGARWAGRASVERP